MSSHGKILVALLALAAAQPATAQTRPPGQPPAGQPGARPGGMPGAAQQQGGGAVRGTVTDPAGKPLGAAQVAVWSAADSTLVTGATTRGNGAFRVEGLRPGSYYLRVSSLGFATQTTATVAISPEAREADLGTIRMPEGSLMLEAITVQTEQAAAAMAPDRNTYRARDLPTAGGTAVDVLRNIPSVEVDQDGRVSLRGNQNVAVQINGRPTPMRGDQLAAFLNQLPANVVENVEVIPNPSAKYEPEGMAGIVNIVLKQNADLGLSYGFQGGVGTGGRYNASGNAGYQAGPLTLYGSLGFRVDERVSTGDNVLQAYVDESRSVLDFYSEQDVTGRNESASQLFNGSADLRLGARDVLSSSVMLSRGGFDAENDNTYLLLEPGGTVTRRIEGLSLNEVNDLTADASLSFKHTVRPQLHELSTELRFNQVENDFSSTNEEALTGGAGSDLRSRQGTDGLTRNLTLQADYTHPLGTATKLETGYKGTMRLLENDQTAARFMNGGWNDLGQSRFEYDETVNAVYGVLSQSFGRLSLQGGLRGEHTDREFSLVEQNQSFPKSYWSFFPSGLASVNIDDQQQVRLSYSRRVQRPDTRMLNPFTLSEDPRNRFTGNPELEPEYTDALELAYQRSFTGGSLQATPFFRRTENAIRRIREVRADTLISTVRNLDTNESYGMDLNGSLRMGKVSGLASFSAFRTVTDAGSAGQELSSDALGWSARVSGTIQVTPRLDVQGFMFYRAPMDIEQGRMSSMTFSSIAVRQKLMGERASVSLRVMDPFDRMGFRLTTRDGLYDQSLERRFGGRAAFLTFSYNFGQQPRMRNRPQQEPQEQPTSIVGP